MIENADEITVILSDESEFKAEIIGRDPKTDIAVLRIEPEDKELSAVSFGNSDSLRVGDWVMAIGNPFGVGQLGNRALYRTIGEVGCSYFKGQGKMTNLK